MQENWNNNKVFRAARTILIDARPTVALPFQLLIEKMKVVLENHMLEFGSVTVLVDNWRAITSNAPVGTYYYITGFKWRPCGNIDYIKHSATVYNASLLFTQNLSDSKASVIIGVHIRGERLLTQYKGNPMYCLEKLDSFLNKSTENISDTHVRIVQDLGKYGTDSCSKGQCYKKRKNFLSEIKQLGYPVVSFDPAEFPFFPRSPAFTSFVEREYLSGVDVLVTLGWGGFQYTISQRFIKRHGGDKHSFHQICKSPSEKKS